MSKKEQINEEEQQINELEKIIDRYYHPHVLATDVYNAGYRKQSEVAKEIFSWLKQNLWDSFEDDGDGKTKVYGVWNTELAEKAAKYGVDINDIK